MCRVNIRATCSQGLLTIKWGTHCASRHNSASIEEADLSCSCNYLNLQILRRSGLNKSLLN